MRLKDIRARMLDQIGSGADSLQDETVDPYLNLAHQYVLPPKLGHTAGLYTFDFSVGPAEDSYDIGFAAYTKSPDRTPTPALVFGVQEPMFDVEYGSELEYLTDPSVFWSMFGNMVDGDTNKGRPKGVLVRGRVATFRPWPDAVYTFRVQTITGPAPLNANGVESDINGMLIASEAASIWGTAFGMADVVQRAEALVAKLLPLAQTAHHSSTVTQRSHAHDWAN